MKKIKNIKTSTSLLARGFVPPPGRLLFGTAYASPLRFLEHCMFVCADFLRPETVLPYALGTQNWRLGRTQIGLLVNGKITKSKNIERKGTWSMSHQIRSFLYIFDNLKAQTCKIHKQEGHKDIQKTLNT